MQVILFRKLAIRTIDLERVRFAAIESGRKWYNRALGTASKKHEAVMELTHEEQCALQVHWLAASELTDSASTAADNQGTDRFISLGCLLLCYCYILA